MDIEQRVNRIERWIATDVSPEFEAVDTEIRRDLAARTDPFRAQVERDAIVDGLRAQVAELRGAMAAQDQREWRAADRCGVPYEQSGCDWPDAVADEVLSLLSQRDAAVKRAKTAERERDEARAFKVPPSVDALLEAQMAASVARTERDATRTRLAECEKALGMWRDYFAAIVDEGMVLPHLSATRAYFAGTAPEVDPLHPTGRCLCGGEGRCSWCLTYAAPAAEVERCEHGAVLGERCEGCVAWDETLGRAQACRCGHRSGKHNAIAGRACCEKDCPCRRFRPATSEVERLRGELAEVTGARDLNRISLQTAIADRDRLAALVEEGRKRVARLLNSAHGTTDEKVSRDMCCQWLADAKGGR